MKLYAGCRHRVPQGSSGWMDVCCRRPSLKTDWKESKMVETQMPYMCECRWGLESWERLKCNKVTITQDCRHLSLPFWQTFVVVMCLVLLWKSYTFCEQTRRLLDDFCIYFYLFDCNILVVFLQHRWKKMCNLIYDIYITVIFLPADTMNCLECVWKWGVNLWK